MSSKKEFVILQRYGPVILECVSQRNPNRKPYQVRLKDGHYSCNCPGWIFCKTPLANGDKQCRHTQKAAQEIVKDPIVITYENELVEKLLDCLPFELRMRIPNPVIQQWSGILKNSVASPRTSRTTATTSTSVRRIVFDD